MTKEKFFITTNGSSGISRRDLDTALETIKGELQYILENNPTEVIDIEINSYEDNDWDGCCPYCGSSEIDFVDEIDGETKYICRCCNQDFLFDEETGECTDRHRRPIRKEED